MKLDSFDRKILAELQKSSKLTNVELASRVGLSPSPCLARVKALEAAGVIKDYVALLDSDKLGGTISVFIHVTLERQSEQVLDIFEKTVSRLPEVMECYLMSGDADYLLRVVVRDTNALRDFVLDKLTRTQGVANIRSSFALKQVKYNTSLPIRELWPNIDSQK
ncbi:Lrp/AsnC family transcriptional regulator (plasmid) [Rhizobium leguminosarum]|jgi:DNA-binding Lrp family transcriptional regulator